jgi:hypothetical protein
MPVSAWFVARLRVAATGPTLAVTRCMRALLACVIAVTFSAVAAAEPQPAGLTDPLNTVPTAAATEPTYEVQLGGEIASSQGENFAAAGAEAAIRAFHSLWIRFGVMGGNATPRAFSCPSGGPCILPGSGMYEVRAGLEARVCGLPMANANLKNLVCWFAGIDIVDMNVSFMSNSEVLELPHVGFDVGTRHVRARIALELGWGEQGSVAGGLDAGIGYRW